MYRVSHKSFCFIQRAQSVVAAHADAAGQLLELIAYLGSVGAGIYSACHDTRGVQEAVHDGWTNGYIVRSNGDGFGDAARKIGQTVQESAVLKSFIAPMQLGVCFLQEPRPEAIGVLSLQKGQLPIYRW